MSAVSNEGQSEVLLEQSRLLLLLLLRPFSRV